MTESLCANRDTDALVAERLLGWQWWCSRSWYQKSEGGEKLWGPWRRFLAPPGWHPSHNAVGDWNLFYRQSDGTEEPYADWCSCTETLLPYFSKSNGHALDMAIQTGLLSAKTTCVLYEANGQWCVAPVTSDNGLCAPLVQADTPALALCQAGLLLKEKKS